MFGTSFQSSTTREHTQLKLRDSRGRMLNAVDHRARLGSIGFLGKTWTSLSAIILEDAYRQRVNRRV